MINIRKLEAELWESADLLRAGSKLTSNQYCMPVLGLIFLRYAYSRFKLVEAEILKDRPMRGGRVLPVEASDFASRSALFLPREAQYAYLVTLPENIPAAGLTNWRGEVMNSLGEVVNNAMELVEQQSEQLSGVLPKDYTMFSDELLAELLRIFNNSALDEVGGDIVGRIYEYFLNKFAKNIAQDDGVFFTPKSLVKMIVNVLEPTQGVLLDPACGSGGMFVQTGDFVEHAGMRANNTMTFYGQEKVFFRRMKESGRKANVERRGPGMADRSVRSCHAVCQMALDKAVEERLIHSNPAIGCKLPPLKGKEMKILTQEEIQRFLIQAKAEGMYELFLLELTTGMRRGELLALRWDDLDFATGKLCIDKQIYPVGGKLILNEPKTKAANRTIILPPAMVELLAEYKKGVFSELMFPSRIRPEQPINPGYVRKRLQVILERAGCKRVRFHE